MESLPGRVRRIVREQGAWSVARKAGERVKSRVAGHESHFWYTLDLAGARPRREMPEGLDLVQGSAADVGHLDAIFNQPRGEHAERQLEDAELWLVREGDKIAFACWIFPERTPVNVSKTGWLALPADTVCLEDSGVSPDFRGRGIAPAAWTAVADTMQKRGFARMITKVAEDNGPSRKAVTKAGFAETARMDTRRTALATKVTIVPLVTPGAEFLVQALTR